MESEVMASEEKLMRKLSLDWLNHLMGVPPHPMRHLFTLLILFDFIAFALESAPLFN
jgi:hypothetical protein